MNNVTMKLTKQIISAAIISETDVIKRCSERFLFYLLFQIQIGNAW